MIFDKQILFRYIIVFSSLIGSIMLMISTHFHIGSGWDLLLFLSGVILFIFICVVFLTILVRYFFTKSRFEKDRINYKLWFYTFIGVFMVYLILFFHIANCQHIIEGEQNIEETRGQWQRV